MHFIIKLNPIRIFYIGKHFNNDGLSWLSINVMLRKQVQLSLLVMTKVYLGFRLTCFAEDASSIELIHLTKALFFTRYFKISGIQFSFLISVSSC